MSEEAVALLAPARRILLQVASHEDTDWYEVADAYDKLCDAIKLLEESTR